MKRRNFLLVLGFIVLTGITGGAYGFYLYFKRHADLTRVAPDFTLQASEFAEAFENNEQEASEKYIDKVLEVTGLISTLKTGTDSTINITLSNPGGISNVICTIQDSELRDVSLKPGDWVVLRGECSGMLMDVLLNNCALIKQGDR